MPVPRHQFSLGVIAGCLASVLCAGMPLQRVPAAMEMQGNWCGVPLAVASYYSVRLWLLRLGLYQLSRAKQQADDWMWIIDHTLQLGDRKVPGHLGASPVGLGTGGEPRLEPRGCRVDRPSAGDTVEWQGGLSTTESRRGQDRRTPGDHQRQRLRPAQRDRPLPPQTSGYGLDVRHQTQDRMSVEAYAPE